MKKMVVYVLLVFIVCSLALVLPAASIENGDIAFNTDRNDNYEIHVMYPDGFGQKPLRSITKELLWVQELMVIIFRRCLLPNQSSVCRRRQMKAIIMNNCQQMHHR